MLKTEAIALFGKAVDLARAVGESKQVIHTWPGTLEERHLEQIVAALWRRRHGIPTPQHQRRRAKTAEAA